MSRVLGLSAGAAGGSAELLLRTALGAVDDAELVRLIDLDLNAPDDLDWLWERLVDSDGLIVSTPISKNGIGSKSASNFSL